VVLVVAYRSSRWSSSWLGPWVRALLAWDHGHDGSLEVTAQMGG
jgi:hypothetical protein